MTYDQKIVLARSKPIPRSQPIPRMYAKVLQVRSNLLSPSLTAVDVITYGTPGTTFTSLLVVRR